MQLAIARGGQYFVGAYIFLILVSACSAKDEIKKMNSLDYFGGIAIIAGVIAAYVFFSTWVEEIEAKRKPQIADSTEKD